MDNQNAEGKAMGVLVRNTGKLTMTRGGNARMVVDATKGNEAIGILLENGGEANITEKDNACMEGRATGIKVGEGCKLDMTRKDNAILSVVPNSECWVEGVFNEGTADISEEDNAKSHFGRQEKVSQNQNDVSGTQQKDALVEPQKNRIKIRIVEKTLDANITFGENEVKENDVLMVEKEVIVTSNNGQQRNLK
uniref:uncharacterized protein LOC120335928 isoform X3 n=1 Tax=Styela clava TaxID=7725 RepID=UPI001939F9DA|nr:uncharacterized protein LOC120335928 isoform X3 [Styela clava]